jgi:hypothetical protein
MLLWCKLPAFFCFGTTFASLAGAHPVWHDFNSRDSIYSFITGTSYLLAGGVKFGVPFYLTAPSPTGTSAVVSWTTPCTHAHTRPQGQPVTSLYLPYLARMAPRYSLCTTANSSITRTNLTYYMSMP